MMAKYDYAKIRQLEQLGYSLKEIAEKLGYDYSNMRIAYWRQKSKQEGGGFDEFVAWLEGNSHLPFAKLVLERIGKDREAFFAAYELFRLYHMLEE